MNLKKENEILKERIIVYKNYANVLKKKNQINKDTMQRMEKLIYQLHDEITRLNKEIKNYERQFK